MFSYSTAQTDRVSGWVRLGSAGQQTVGWLADHCCCCRNQLLYLHVLPFCSLLLHLMMMMWLLLLLLLCVTSIYYSLLPTSTTSITGPGFVALHFWCALVVIASLCVCVCVLHSLLSFAFLFICMHAKQKQKNLQLSLAASIDQALEYSSLSLPWKPIFALPFQCRVFVRLLSSYFETTLVFS